MDIRKSLLIGVPALCLLLACGDEPPPGDGGWEWPTITVAPSFVMGGPAVDFALPVLPTDGSDSIGQDSVRLSAHLGQVVVLDFWNSGCAPCVAEHGTLNEVAEEYWSRGVRFFGITDLDTPSSVARFAERHGAFVYPNLSDRGKSVSGAYRARGWPTKVVIDTAGRVAWWRLGGPIEKATLEEVIEDVLAGRRPAAQTSAVFPDD